MVLEQIILASAAVSLISFVGIFSLAMKDRLLHALLPVFVSFAAGAMIAAAFFDVMPESIRQNGVDSTMAFIVAGILIFFPSPNGRRQRRGLPRTLGALVRAFIYSTPGKPEKCSS